MSVVVYRFAQPLPRADLIKKFSSDNEHACISFIKVIWGACIPITYCPTKTLQYLLLAMSENTVVGRGGVENRCGYLAGGWGNSDLFAIMGLGRLLSYPECIQQTVTIAYCHKLGARLHKLYISTTNFRQTI